MKTMRLYKILTQNVTSLNQLVVALRDETKDTETVLAEAKTLAKNMDKQLSEK